MLFTGVERVYDSKRRQGDERVGEERDSGAKREVARQQPAWGVVDGDDYDNNDNKGIGQDKDDDNG